MVAGSSVAGCHGPSSTCTSTDLSGVPSFSTTPSTLCRAPSSRDARDERLQLHVRDGGLGPLHLAVDHLAAQRAVPARLILAEVLDLLHVDFRQPLDVGDAVPARARAAAAASPGGGQRLAVQRVGEKRLRRQRLVARQAAAELLLDLELLRRGTPLPPRRDRRRRTRTRAPPASRRPDRARFAAGRRSSGRCSTGPAAVAGCPSTRSRRRVRRCSSCAARRATATAAVRRARRPSGGTPPDPPSG